jgi:Domain of unknown function (DUF1906)/Hemopexin
MEALLGQGLFVSSPLPSETICIDIRHDAMSKFYFFHGDKYCRYDAKADSVDADYLPAYASITDNWSGLPTGVDAALNWGNGKTFFFVASEYYRYDNGNDSVLRWCGFYLAPAPSQVLGVGWMNGNIQPIVTKLPLLQHIGWKIAPIYVGQQQPDLAGMSHHGNAAQGALDAGHAATLATAAGFPAGTILYLDIEKSPTQLESGMRDYYTSWVETIPALGFRPGVYCPFQYAQTLLNLNRAPAFWVVNGTKFPAGHGATYSDPLFPAPEPLLTTVPFASAWQLAVDVQATLGNQTISPWDCDSCSYKDPSSIP